MAKETLKPTKILFRRRTLDSPFDKLVYLPAGLTKAEVDNLIVELLKIRLYLE